MFVRGDYHTHSQYSHGQGEIRGNIQTAIKKGLKELAITDHGPRTFNFIRLGVKDAEQLLTIREEVVSLQPEFPDIKLLSGVEANIINAEGELDVPEKILEGLDIVAAGFHLLIWPPDWQAARQIVFDNRITYKLLNSRRAEIRQRNTEAVIRAVQRYKINFITHPGYGVDIDTCALARACARAGTLLEINARHGQFTEDFVQAASQTAVNFIINSDAHSPHQVGELAAGIEIVKQLGLKAERVFNLSV